MKTKDISEAKDPDLRASMAALQRASLLARQTGYPDWHPPCHRQRRATAADLCGGTPPKRRRERQTMTDIDQKALGKTLWNIADQLRGAMNADDFRDYMLSFLFLRYLSDNYETAARKELGKDYPTLGANDRRVPLAL